MSSPKAIGELTQKALRDVKRKSASGLASSSMTKVTTLSQPRQSLQTSQTQINSSKNSFLSTQKSIRPGCSRAIEDKRYKKENQTSKKKDSISTLAGNSNQPTLAQQYANSAVRSKSLFSSSKEIPSHQRRRSKDKKSVYQSQSMLRDRDR
jgi:hypothetical protein